MIHKIICPCCGVKIDSDEICDYYKDELGQLVPIYQCWSCGIEFEE